MADITGIARRAHAGQVDKAGRDYVDAHLAPIAEAAAVFGPDAESAGWLHDVLEDTSITAAELLRLGVDAAVVDAVDSVTRRADETYDQLIDRACAHPLGRHVKLVDNAWNIASRPFLAAIDAELAATMVTERYLPARARLLAAAALTEDSPEMREVQAVLDRHLERLGAPEPA